MQWALHDPAHGAYGAGRLHIGTGGDFVTAPSMGPDFASLLAPQLIDWLKHLGSGPLALIETGPGEGALALQLAQEMVSRHPDLVQRLTLVLVEPNPGMAARQRGTLVECPLPCRWATWRELAASPLHGVVIAHEVLDALAVDRIVWDGARWRTQLVVLNDADRSIPTLHLEAGPLLSSEQLAHLASLGLDQITDQLPVGWCTEIHSQVADWLAACSAALASGQLLVIDYALEARRYYAPQRSAGTLMAYRGQRASDDPLREPGAWDLTAHLCIEALQADAIGCGWTLLGQARQGEALLALGLAERLAGLQRGEPSDLATLLARREALLRLVDPHALGDFRWLAFQRSAGRMFDGVSCSGLPPRFLCEPGSRA